MLLIVVVLLHFFLENVYEFVRRLLYLSLIKFNRFSAEQVSQALKVLDKVFFCLGRHFQTL